METTSALRKAQGWSVRVAALPALLVMTVAGSQAGVPDSGKDSRWREQFGQLPLAFEQNQGQTDRRVQWLARGRGYTLFLTGSEAVLALHPKTPAAQAGQEVMLGPNEHAVVRLQLSGARAPQGAGSAMQPGITTYQKGSMLATSGRYGRVTYPGVYPGIDVVYYGQQRELEYDFVIAPHARPEQIRLRFSGVDSRQLTPAGELVLQTRVGALVQHAPVAYQMIAGQRRAVQAAYTERGGEVSFTLGEYDHTQPLVIDPVLSYSTFIGGSANDVVNAIALDVSGNAYLAGTTYAPIFPSSPSPVTLRGITDAYVAKLNPAGNALRYLFYVGGSGTELGSGVAVDATGSAYLVGTTVSSDFPVSTLQVGYAGAADGFLVKINPTGTALLFGTYLGGTAADFAQGVALDPDANVYVTGYTYSADFPVSLGAFQSVRTGNPHSAFVVKVNASGTGRIYSTYLGGSLFDSGVGIAADAAGNAYVVGNATSSNFPVVSARQPANAGGYDVFVTKLNVNGSALLYSTYLGGSSGDFAGGIAVDSLGQAYITGQTYSPNFPITPNALRPGLLGPSDAFLAKLDVTGSVLLYGTFYGLAGSEAGRGIAVDNTGTVYMAGSTTGQFPLVDPLQSVLAGPMDGFVVKIDTVNNLLPFSSYLGGQGSDMVNAIAVDNQGNAYVGGTTNSPDFPQVGPILNATGGGFAAKIATLASGQVPLYTKPAIYQGGLWAEDLNGNGAFDGTPVDRLFFFGFPGAIPVAGDWTGDGRTKAGIFYAGTWYLDLNNNGSWDGPGIDRLVQFGVAGDIPVVGDWNGDGRAKVGIVRNAIWFLDYDNSGYWSGPGIDRSFTFGLPTDTPVTGDWNGDGRTEVGVYRAGVWFLDQNGNYVLEGLGPDMVVLLGTPNDLPVTGDWNGDGRTKVGVFRDGLWTVDINGNGLFEPGIDRTFLFGSPGDRPLGGRW